MNEIECKACDGTGVRTVKHPSEPDKRIIARCNVCNGKGRLKQDAK